MSLRRITILSVDLTCRYWEFVFTNTISTRPKVPRLSLRKESPGLCILPVGTYYYCTVCNPRSLSRKKLNTVIFPLSWVSASWVTKQWRIHLARPRFFLTNVYISYRRDYGSFEYRKLICENREKQLNISSMLFSSSCSNDVKIFQSL